MKIAFVTCAIGNDYIDKYYSIFRGSQEAYAKKHGYDFRIVTEWMDSELMHWSLVSFQKALIFSQPWAADYDLILFVDADIYINPSAPAIHLICDPEKINIVNEFAQPSKELRYELQKRCEWETTATEYYKLCNFDLDTDVTPNTGVMVASPKLYGEYFKEIYETYKEIALTYVGTKRGTFIFEQTALGYRIVKDSKYKCIPNVWNGVWVINHLIYPEKTLEEFINENYFIHHAGQYHYAELKELLKAKGET